MHVVLRRWIQIIVCVTLTDVIASGCGHTLNRTDSSSASSTPLDIKCVEDEAALSCRAMLRLDGEADVNAQDVTDTAQWSSSDERAIVARNGRVAANAAGVATITATLQTGEQTHSSSFLVVVDQKRRPRQAYSLQGEVRDFSSFVGVGGVSVTLVDEEGSKRTVITPAEGETTGQFLFSAVPSGTYRIRVARYGYRSTERTVTVPQSTPYTMTMLAEPPAR